MHTQTNTPVLGRTKNNQYARYINYLTYNIQEAEKTTIVKEVQELCSEDMQLVAKHYSLLLIYSFEPFIPFF